MIIFQYTIKLLDPLFYSREGLSGAVTPSYLHATAINHAVAYANGEGGNQPYIMAETNGGRNIPRYKNSFITRNFYFTPARIKENPSYLPEIVKGESDGFIRKVSPGAEILRASQLFLIPPETEFKGYGYIKSGFSLTEIIRFGSFRGKAKLIIAPAKFVGEAHKVLVDHPTDPLVCKTSRGVMINIFPYPIIENAVCDICYKIRIDNARFNTIVALPVEDIKEQHDEIMIEGDTLIV